MDVVRVDCCPACTSCEAENAFSPDAAAWERFRDLSRVKYQGYMDEWCGSLSLEVQRCRRCGHLWHHTQPDFHALMGMYDAGVSLNTKNPARDPSRSMLRSMNALLRLIRVSRKIHTPTFLDYGSGRGRWSRAAALAGFRVVAYEPNATRASATIGGFEVINRLEELDGQRFDVVNLEQVLEHVQEPLSVLRELQNYLKPDSLLRITVPNVARVPPAKLWHEFPFNGRSMHILSPYEHLQGFTPRSFTALLEKAGFVPERSWAFWRTHAVHSARALLGRWLPVVATTAALVRLESAVTRSGQS